MKNKLLIHRLRGFGCIENSYSALTASLNSNYEHFEIDTRVSKDGVIFVHHNPYVKDQSGSKIHFYCSDSVDLRKVKYSNGEHLLLLENALEMFSDKAKRNQKLCIDIKDYGYEEKYLNLVKSIGIESKVCFISWIPQTILRFYSLACESKLVLAHFNLLKLGPVGKNN